MVGRDRWTLGEVERELGRTTVRLGLELLNPPLLGCWATEEEPDPPELGRVVERSGLESLSEGT